MLSGFGSAPISAIAPAAGGAGKAASNWTIPMLLGSQFGLGLMGGGAKNPNATATFAGNDPNIDPRVILQILTDEARRNQNDVDLFLEKPINFGSSIAQTPPSFFGPDLPVSIGVEGTDPALLDPSLLTRDPIRRMGGGPKVRTGGPLPLPRNGNAMQPGNLDLVDQSSNTGRPGTSGELELEKYYVDATPSGNGDGAPGTSGELDQSDMLAAGGPSTDPVQQVISALELFDTPSSENPPTRRRRA